MTVRDLVHSLSMHPQGIEAEALRHEMGMEKLAFGDLFAEAKESGAILSFGGYALPASSFAGLVTQIWPLVEAAHASDPAAAYIPLSPILRSLGLGADEKQARRIAAALTGHGFRAKGASVGITTVAPVLDARQKALLRRVQTGLEESGWDLIPLRALALKLAVPPPAVDHIVELAVAAGILLPMGKDRAATPEMVQALVGQLKKTFGGKAFDLGDVRREGILPRRVVEGAIEALVAGGYFQRTDEGYRRNS